MADTQIIMASTFKEAKMAVQNRTTSNNAGPDQWLGLYGDSVEGASVAVLNRRKEPTQYERETFTAIPGICGPIKYSMILDQVWANTDG